MSMRTFYVRKDNEDFFDSLPNKSKTLNGILAKLQTDAQETNAYKNLPQAPERAQFREENGIPVFVPKPPDPVLGYPCCQQKRPCKHWSFNGTTSTWINELTGKTKEAAV